MKPTTDQAKPHRYGVMTVITILLFMVLALAMGLALFTEDPKTRQLFWYYFDIRHWPIWYAVNLWLIVVGLLVVPWLKQSHVQKRIQSVFDSKFCHSAVRCFKFSKLNLRIARFFLRRKPGKKIFRKWNAFWGRFRVENFYLYAFWIILIAIGYVFFRNADIMAGPRLFLYQRYYFYYTWPYRNIYEPFYYIPLATYFFTGKIGWRLFIAPVTGILMILCLLRWTGQYRKRRSRA